MHIRKCEKHVKSEASFVNKEGRKLFGGVAILLHKASQSNIDLN